MKIILVSQRLGNTKTLNVSQKRLMLLLLLAAFMVSCLVFFGFKIATFQTDPALDGAIIGKWQAQMQSQSEMIEAERLGAQEQLDAMAVLMAEYRARLLRLDALGERLTVMAKLDRGEFNFSKAPAVGGPEEGASLEKAYSDPDFIGSMDRLSVLIDDREQQLEILETLMSNRQVEDAGYLAGRPIKKGWMSSRFGRRTDPFHGRIAWHKGVDFAGKEDSEIIAVASGVITWSGDRYGYGDMVEINHGNGYSTRYAHNKENMAAVGDIVKKGQVIAKMGSSGRSTGPHVHFEVYKNGKAVDPSRYIYRASR